MHGHDKGKGGDKMKLCAAYCVSDNRAAARIVETMRSRVLIWGLFTEILNDSVHVMY